MWFRLTKKKFSIACAGTHVGTLTVIVFLADKLVKVIGPVWCLPVWAIENFFLVKQYHMAKERFFIQIERFCLSKFILWVQKQIQKVDLVTIQDFFVAVSLF